MYTIFFTPEIETGTAPPLKFDDEIGAAFTIMDLFYTLF